MLKKDLAAALGISPQMVRKLERRGMPLQSVEAAKAWRSRHLEATRTKQHRADGNTGMPYKRVPKQRHQDRSDDSEQPGVAELSMYRSAALFTAKFGIERFGPLLIHLSCVMSDDAHDVLQQAIDRGEPDTPAAIDEDAWEAISTVYFEWLPPGCPEAKEVDCSGR